MDSVEIWVKPLSGETWAVCFLNRGKVRKDIKFSWQEHAISDTFSKRKIDCARSIFAIRDLWSGKDSGQTKKPFVRKIESHDVYMLKLSPVN